MFPIKMILRHFLTFRASGDYCERPSSRARVLYAFFFLLFLSPGQVGVGGMILLL